MPEWQQTKNHIDTTAKLEFIHMSFRIIQNNNRTHAHLEKKSKLEHSHQCLTNRTFRQAKHKHYPKTGEREREREWNWTHVYIGITAHWIKLDPGGATLRFSPSDLVHQVRCQSYDHWEGRWVTTRKKREGLFNGSCCCWHGSGGTGAITMIGISTDGEAMVTGRWRPVVWRRRERGETLGASGTASPAATSAAQLGGATVHSGCVN